MLGKEKGHFVEIDGSGVISNSNRVGWRVGSTFGRLAVTAPSLALQAAQQQKLGRKTVAISTLFKFQEKTGEERGRMIGLEGSPVAMVRPRRRETATSGTALVLIFTEQGFLFAADGLEGQANGKPISTSTQKIFHLRDSLAFSSSGFRRIQNSETGEIKFDISTTIQKAFEQSVESFPCDFDKLTVNMAERISIELAELKEKQSIENFPEVKNSDCFAEIFLAGYFHYEPKEVLICFCQKGENCEARIQNERIAPGFFAYRGSPSVWKALLYNDDDKLQTHRCAAFDKMISLSGPNLDEAKSVAQAYIQACSDPAVQEGYSECKSIGGSLYMASITPELGFKWITKPL